MQKYYIQIQAHWRAELLTYKIYTEDRDVYGAKVQMQTYYYDCRSREQEC